MLCAFSLLTVLSPLSMMTSILFCSLCLLTVLRAMRRMTEHDQWTEFCCEKIVLSFCDVQVLTQ